MRYYLAIVLTIVFFSTVEVVTKLVGRVDPELLAFVRFFPAGVVLLLIGARRVKTVTPRDLLALAALGLVGVTVTFAAYHTGLLFEHLPASTAATIFSVNPVFTALTAAVMLGERLTGRRVAGLVLGLGGIYVVGFGFGPIAFETARGPLLMFAAQVTFGVYVAVARKYVARYGPFAVNGVIFVAGSLPFLLMIREWRVPASGPALWWIFYLAVFATGLAYVLYFYGLNKVPVVAGTSIFYLKPILSSLLAVCALAETLKPTFYLGLVVIFVSLTLTTSRGVRCEKGEG